MISGHRGLRLAAALAPGLALLAACSDSPTSAARQDSDAVDAVLAVIAMSPSLGSSGTSSTPGSPIDDTRSCPGGGSVSLKGTIAAQVAAGVVTADLTLTRTSNACTYSTAGGRVVVDGSVTGTSHTRSRTASPGQQVTLLEFSETEKGSMTATTAGAVVTCAIDLAYVFDPAKSTMRVSGTACGQKIDRSLPFTPPTVPANP